VRWRRCAAAGRAVLASDLSLSDQRCVVHLCEPLADGPLGRGLVEKQAGQIWRCGRQAGDHFERMRL
jgi:hypothetical protein